MAMFYVLLFFYFGSVYSETQIATNMAKETMSDNMQSGSMLETSISKIKRHSWPVVTTPCPPYWPQNKIWQVSQKPTYPIKPVYRTAWQPSNAWQSSYDWKNNEWPMTNGWVKPASVWPMTSGWSKPASAWPSATIGWSKSASGWQASNWQPSQWQPKIVVQKPAPVYLPQYDKPLYNHVPEYHYNVIKPVTDCPPYVHEHQQKSGIVYAPQHQYPIQSYNKYHYQQPQYIKVAKPVYKAPPPTYLPPPTYHQYPNSHIDVCDK